METWWLVCLRKKKKAGVVGPWCMPGQRELRPQSWAGAVIRQALENPVGSVHCLPAAVGSRWRATQGSGALWLLFEGPTESCEASGPKEGRRGRGETFVRPLPPGKCPARRHVGRAVGEDGEGVMDSRCNRIDRTCRGLGGPSCRGAYLQLERHLDNQQQA